jgi:hypothetical protein
LAKKLNLKELPAVSKDTADFLLIFAGVAVIAYALYMGGVFSGRDAKIIEFPRKPNQGDGGEIGNANKPGNTDQ